MVGERKQTHPLAKLVGKIQQTLEGFDFSLNFHQKFELVEFLVKIWVPSLLKKISVDIQIFWETLTTFIHHLIGI